jgi:DNA-binding LacI/PurR family transcriptional regulator
MAGRYLIERGHREIGVIPVRWSATPARAVWPVL